MRESTVGTLVNYPMGPDGKARAGKGYIWRIVRVDKVQRSLVLAFEQPHPEMTEAE